jgi:outer membrane protein assembly factor BamE (lipoprotein component of BamABCDE complex)
MLPFVVLIFSAGCILATEREGRSVDPENLIKIRPGIPKAEVLKSLGVPSTDEIGPDGEVLSYRHREARSAGLFILLEGNWEESWTLKIALDQSGNVARMWRTP